MLLNIITKIGGILRVAFGVSGATIIKNNLNEESELDPMRKGKVEKHLIFMYCTILNIKELTNAYGEEVMVIVNRATGLLHGIVYQHGGDVMQVGCVSHERSLGTRV